MDFVIGAFVGASILAIVIAVTLDREPDVNLTHTWEGKNNDSKSF